WPAAGRAGTGGGVFGAHSSGRARYVSRPLSARHGDTRRGRNGRTIVVAKRRGTSRAFAWNVFRYAEWPTWTARYVARHHRPSADARRTSALAEDGGGGAAGSRNRARLQQLAHCRQW